ncbi:putative disease resistance RPP13-like protein 1 [Bidens hawaiensis]|uniref:putative disease resistance RPP13-like protein 1 n=1 Tax=Bidens hawaiensis TaxID=980011 RepID=UPI00404918F8
MAEIVLSAFLAVLFEKLATTALKKLDHYKGIDAEIKKLEGSLNLIQDLLTDASQKELTNRSVKGWLNDLQHLAYNIDDVLDDLATEAMHREFNGESEGMTSKVRKLIPTCCTNFSLTHDKFENITAKLQELVDQKTTLGLVVVKEETRPKDINRRLQTSMVDASSIVGRQAEKEALVRELLQDEGGAQNFSIVPIVGMGGVGKTTLARLLYDEQQVKDRFELKAWVCVSDEFDSFGISKVIFQSVTRETKKFADLNLLQEALKERLKQKKFLLVLDDVWSERRQDWETLVGPFHACAHGSKIIMTTRKYKLLEKLGYGNLTQLQSLSHDDAMSLFALYALGVNNFDSHLSLKPYGVGIVEKCAGLPLALKALGSLLSTKREEEEYWKKVLDSEIWGKEEIVPALRLSYQDLSAQLKQLFAYCSLFPKDYVFDKKPLVQLWMAEGFLYRSTSSDSTGESLGDEYFDELLSRSFFQHAPSNESLFVMHDLMSDLATSVADEFFLRFENDNKKKALEKYRHISFICEEYVRYNKFETFKGARSLRTFMAMSFRGVEQSWFWLSNKILVDLFSELPLLRVLSLSYSGISEVPESIGTLRHLRYLNLSKTQIKQLPENVSNLYNLETLIVFGCRRLAELPNNFSKLKNLRHLDIRDTPRLNHLPLGIGGLKNLQTLSKFIIKGESGYEITKLRDLKNLCGEISIVGLEKVQNATYASEANISQKRLSTLEVVWSEVSPNAKLEMVVLTELKPNSDYLKQLKIVSYSGLEFPKWVADPSFQFMKNVSIRDCKKCASLPPLGQLRSLKVLSIKGLDGLKVVGLELLGNGSAFLSLEILRFENMGGWEKWSIDSGVVFPRLQELYIKDCPNLVEVSVKALPSLKVLEIHDCPNLVEVSVEELPSLNVLALHTCDSGLLRRLVEIAPTITNLEIKCISGLNDVVWRDKYLGAVEKLSIKECNEIRYLWESEAVASKVLVNLNDLKVSNCHNLLSLGEKEEGDNCNTITDISLPTRGQKLKSIQIMSCTNLLESEWGGQKMNNIRRMLEDVYIEGWVNLKSIIGLKYLVHLTTLRIFRCENLESFPDNELSNLASLKNLSIVNCPRMDACGVWPPNLRLLEIGKLKKPISEWGPENMPAASLVELKLYGGESDGVICSCSELSHLLPSSLTRFNIYGFEKLESVSMGLQHLTSLKHLQFYNCPKLKQVSLHLQHLTSLQHLNFYYCPKLKQVSLHLQHLTSLQHLNFYNCPILNKLLLLSHPQVPHTSLQHLSFSECPNMMHLPEMMLPSLLGLYIYKCPKLEETYSKNGSDWPHISHIPRIDIEGS